MIVMTEMGWTEEEYLRQDPDRLAGIRWYLSARRFASMPATTVAWSKMEHYSQAAIGLLLFPEADRGD